MNSIEWINFNINDYVKVKLTQKGKYLYSHQYDEMNKHILKSGDNPLIPVELQYDSDGYAEFQLWHLMGIFGEYLFNGCDVPFETMIKFRIHIDGEK